jgi:hypothetical protein
MNWTAVGAIGELVGAIAVVVSLAYLAVQISQNTRAVRAATIDSAVRGIRDWIRPLIEDKKVAEIFRQGIENWDSLDDDGKARFLHLMLGFMKTVETLHYQYSKGQLDPSVWLGWQYVMTGYIQSPGGQKYWELRRMAFSSEFRDYVESLPENTDFIRAAQLAERTINPVAS